MDYTLEIYKHQLTSLKRGRTSFGLSKAKPLFLITLIDFIPVCKENQIIFGTNLFSEMYDTNRLIYASECRTPYEVPFFHLHSEPFYSLEWFDASITSKISHTPSGKFLRENLRYAKLDDELWELLQDPENREYLKQAIIDQYLKD